MNEVREVGRPQIPETGGTVSVVDSSQTLPLALGPQGAPFHVFLTGVLVFRLPVGLLLSLLWSWLFMAMRTIL